MYLYLWFAYNHHQTWPYLQSLWWPSRGHHSVEDLPQLCQRSEPGVCVYWFCHSHLEHIQMLYFIALYTNQGLFFLYPDRENIFQKCSPLGSWQQLWYLASDRRAFSEECHCFGIIILCSFNSIQLHRNSGYSLKLILIVWKRQDIVLLPFFRRLSIPLLFTYLSDTLLWNVSHSLKSLWQTFQLQQQEKNGCYSWEVYR